MQAERVREDASEVLRDWAGGGRKIQEKTHHYYRNHHGGPRMDFVRPKQGQNFFGKTAAHLLVLSAIIIHRQGIGRSMQLSSPLLAHLEDLLEGERGAHVRPPDEVRAERLGEPHVLLGLFGGVAGGDGGLHGLCGQKEEKSTISSNTAVRNWRIFELHCDTRKTTYCLEGRGGSIFVASLSIAHTCSPLTKFCVNLALEYVSTDTSCVKHLAVLTTTSPLPDLSASAASEPSELREAAYWADPSAEKPHTLTEASTETS